jgi:nucleotide-binding universal stress UspA family protein
MRMLVAIDFSDCSDRALAQALRWARSRDARLYLVHVHPQSPLSNPDSATARLELDEARMRLERLREEAESTGVVATIHVESGSPVFCLLHLIDAIHPDVVVVGRRGRGALARMLVGSVSERILRESPVPVLLVPPVP